MIGQSSFSEFAVFPRLAHDLVQLRNRNWKSPEMLSIRHLPSKDSVGHAWFGL
jgi:hypothetical protein